MKSMQASVAVLGALCLSACTGGLFQTKIAPPTLYMLSAGPNVAGAGGTVQFTNNGTAPARKYFRIRSP